MHDDVAEPKPGKTKPYPRRCGDCAAITVEPSTISYAAEVKHDGRLHHFQIPKLPVDRCATCGEVYFTNASDEQLTYSLRQHLGVLQPAEIRSGIALLGLTQRAFAERIGVAAESVSRWMSGQNVQSRALDNLMRLFLTFPNVREALPAPVGAHESYAPLPTISR
jgi:putative zinc finger/helix-turn-helix YgiT family protein